MIQYLFYTQANARKKTPAISASRQTLADFYQNLPEVLACLFQAHRF